MSFSFEMFLVLAVIISAIVGLFDILFLAKRREKSGKKMPWYSDYARALFPVFFAVLVIRTFIFEPFRIPSGSLKPTLLVGDLIFVTKYNYGLRWPITNNKIITIGEPKRGDIMVFHWPVNPNYDLIKRVIGLPGDHISYVNKQLFINGQEILQIPDGFDMDTNDGSYSWPVQKMQENLLGLKHGIFLNPLVPSFDLKDIVVPQGEYFVMGDNRDNSEDSRYWGFVPEKNLLGKAQLVIVSWDSSAFKIRWNRIGKRII